MHIAVCINAPRSDAYASLASCFVASQTMDKDRITEVVANLIKKTQEQTLEADSSVAEKIAADFLKNHVENVSSINLKGKVIYRNIISAEA